MGGDRLAARSRASGAARSTGSQPEPSTLQRGCSLSIAQKLQYKRVKDAYSSGIQPELLRYIEGA